MVEIRQIENSNLTIARNISKSVLFLVFWFSFYLNKKMLTNQIVFTYNYVHFLVASSKFVNWNDGQKAERWKKN